MELITIVCDGNPDIDNALDILGPYVSAHLVKSVRPVPAMGDALEASVDDDARRILVRELTAAKFRIVEGGQL